MRVTIFGGMGLIGSSILNTLIDNQIYVNVFIEHQDNVKIFNKSIYANIFYGNNKSDQIIQDSLNKSDVVIFVPNETNEEEFTVENEDFQFAKRCIDISKEKENLKFLLISSKWANENATGSLRAKYLIEEYLKKTSLDFAVLKASFVLGDKENSLHRDFCIKILDSFRINKFLFSFFPKIFIFNSGYFHLSPIFVEDISKAVFALIKEKKLNNKFYKLGNSHIRYRDFLNEMQKAMSKNYFIIHLPMFFAKVYVKLFQGFESFGMKYSELENLFNNKEPDYDDVFEKFNISQKILSSNNLSHLSHNS